MSFTPNTDFETLLSAVTEAILSGNNGTTLVPSAHRRAVERYIPLIRSLKNTYSRVQPSRRYVARIQHELVGQQYTMVDRVRYLPPRVQIAAVFAIIAGLLVLVRGRAMLLQHPSQPLGEAPEGAA